RLHSTRLFAQAVDDGIEAITIQAADQLQQLPFRSTHGQLTDDHANPLHVCCCGLAHDPLGGTYTSTASTRCVATYPAAANAGRRNSHSPSAMTTAPGARAPTRLSRSERCRTW